MIHITSMKTNAEISNTINKIKSLTIKDNNPVGKTIERINIEDVNDLPNSYPDDFIAFCKTNELSPPKITTKNGIALSVMLLYPNKYWDRESCDAFIKKFNIKSKDSIQLFNKHSQWGIATNSGIERGRLYIIFPYALSKKHIMRKDFKFDGTSAQKNLEIDKLKRTIMSDYIDSPNEQWQLGHKNPEMEDNTMNNLVLQPPIQAKYRDQYIFIDPLTKVPTPKKLISMINQKKSPFTVFQLKELKSFLNTLSDI